MIHIFTYDADRRIAKNIRVPADQTITRTAFSGTYNLDNQLTAWTWSGGTQGSVGYDADGNMTSGPLKENQFGTFVYDARNRLTAAGGVGYTYDSANNRRMVMYSEGNNPVSISYVYDRSGKLPNVLIRNKSVSGSAKSTYYVYGAGLDYEVSFNADGTESEVRYYHYDQVGSTIALTDGSGNITDKFSYDAWGYVRHTLGTSDTPFLYVGIFGIQTDPNGLINMRARYYNPTTMSFITSDPSGFSGGMNWYLYANGNPLMYTDSSGFWYGYDDVAFAGAGMIIGIAGQLVADSLSGELSSFETYAGAALGGGMAGLALLYTANPYFAGGVAGLVSNGTTQLLEKHVTGSRTSFDFTELAFSTTIGIASGLIPGRPRITGVNAGRGSYYQVFQQMRTKAINGQATSICPQTAYKMTVGAFYHNAISIGAVASSYSSNWYSSHTTSSSRYNSISNVSMSLNDYGFRDYISNSSFFNNK